MAFAVVDKSTGEIVHATTWTPIDHDSATQFQLQLSALPDSRTQRWDGSAGVRAATPQEISEYDAAHPPDTTIKDIITVVADDSATPQEKADAKAHLLARRNR